MYPDFLVSPELALDCFRQEIRVRDRDADRERQARHAKASPSSGHSSLLHMVKAAFNRPYLRLKPKPELASMAASSR